MDGFEVQRVALIMHALEQKVILLLLFFCTCSCIDPSDFLSIQDQYRLEPKSGLNAKKNDKRDLAEVVPGDDDHVWSSSPTESTNAPTPSGTADISAQCLAQCSSYDASAWNLDNWCKFYWDAGCYLPDVNYLEIAPAGKAEVANYDCVPSCLQDSRCGPAYCKTFSHLSSSCRTGYAHLLYNSTLQDHTHEQCMDSFIQNMFAGHNVAFSPSLLTHYIWQAVFTITPVNWEDVVAEETNSLVIRSAVAHVLSGVSLKDVEVVAISDASVAVPTMQPTLITPQPTLWPSHNPTEHPTELPTSRPTTDDSTICQEPAQNHWCNNNQEENIYLGKATSASECQALCNAYVGVDFISGCCQWYRGNIEVLYSYNTCSLQPNGEDTIWSDLDSYWSAGCNSISAHPSLSPTIAPTLGSGEMASPTPVPTLATPIPTRQPSAAPTVSPTASPSAFQWSQFPTQPPTFPVQGTRITVQINSTAESLGWPVLPTEQAYAQLKAELHEAFASSGFADSLKLSSTWYNAITVLAVIGMNELSTSFPGFDVDGFPTAAPTVDNGTPAPTPTTFFEPQNSTATDEADNTGAIVGGSAAAVVGVGAVGTAVYQYNVGDLIKVGAEPVEGMEFLQV